MGEQDSQQEGKEKLSQLCECDQIKLKSQLLHEIKRARGAVDRECARHRGVRASRWIDAGCERDKLKKMDIHVEEIKRIELTVKENGISGIKNGKEEKRKETNQTKRIRQGRKKI